MKFFGVLSSWNLKFPWIGGSPVTFTFKIKCLWNGIGSLWGNV